VFRDWLHKWLPQFDSKLRRNRPAPSFDGFTIPDSVPDEFVPDFESGEIPKGYQVFSNLQIDDYGKKFRKAVRDFCGGIGKTIQLEEDSGKPNAIKIIGSFYDGVCGERVVMGYLPKDEVKRIKRCGLMGAMIPRLTEIVQSERDWTYVHFQLLGPKDKNMMAKYWPEHHRTYGTVPPSSYGKCEGCGNSPRVLRQIESGQSVCKTCLREIHGPKGSTKLARLTQIENLRQRGFDVSDDLTKAEADRLERVYSLRSIGIDVPLDTPLEELVRRHEAYCEEIREYVNLPSPVENADLWHGLVDVAGMSYPNRDGTSRAEIVQRCVIGEQVQLIPEPKNPYDPNAVMVCRKTGEQIGYLPRQCAAEIAAECSLQRLHWALVDSIGVGGEEVELPSGKSKPIYRVRLLMVVVQPGVMQETVTEYICAVRKARHASAG
jgi:hypothetical protein